MLWFCTMGDHKPRILYYELEGGWRLLVGGSDDANELVSLELAEPDDWWFHVDDVAGSHVILRAKPDEEPSRDTLRDAAAIAAYHSKARNAGTVSVYCTRACHVKKPRGAKIGTVSVSRGTLLKVRPDNTVGTRVSAGSAETKEP